MPERFTALFETFAGTLAAAGGEAVSLDLAEIAETIAGTGAHPVWASRPVVAAFPQLFAELEKRGITVQTSGTPEEVRDQPLGIAVARIAIAETGSVLLDERELADRAVTLMTQQLIVLCPREGLVPSLYDAAPVLREIASRGSSSYATLVTGPSRTADIERELAIGVQGPGILRVVFVIDSASH